MREIKFRAWEKERKAMLGSNCVNLIMFFDGQVNEIDCNGKFPLTDLQKEAIIVMQYTGLKDKNGKEIYEGDLIKHINADRAWEINYAHSLARFMARLVDSTQEENLSFIAMQEFEIIGNIHENPDLLKEGGLND